MCIRFVLPGSLSLAAAWVALLAISALPARGDEPPPGGPEVEAAKKFQAYAKESAAAYDARAENQDGRKLSLRTEPILRWTNPLGARQAHGEVFLWTDQGRPMAVLSMYQFTSPEGEVHEHHEFSSLAAAGLYFASLRPVVWAPADAGVEWKALSAAPAPAASARQRLIQMRDLAEKFRAEKTTRENETRALRLLSQPVYRYELTNADDDEIRDGALFAFVEATDPEIFLVLEARTLGGKPTWHYGAVRMTSLRLVVYDGDQAVWEADRLSWRDVFNRKEQPYTAFQMR